MITLMLIFTALGIPMILTKNTNISTVKLNQKSTIVINIFVLIKITFQISSISARFLEIKLIFIFH